MAAQKYEFKVEMTCGGCSSAVERVLGRMEGIQDKKIDLEKQRVIVETTLPSDEVLAALKKTGKATEFIGTC
ncbi:copper transport protein ATOX1-like [Diadema antillarum]|uniref:copper transport protein ATOX1-like n=1 Tax=Diadema antillarum TaxID=105358 RepID=UPI003A884DEB